MMTSGTVTTWTEVGTTVPTRIGEVDFADARSIAAGQDRFRILVRCSVVSVVLPAALPCCAWPCCAWPGCDWPL